MNCSFPKTAVITSDDYFILLDIFPSGQYLLRSQKKF